MKIIKQAAKLAAAGIALVAAVSLTPGAAQASTSFKDSTGSIVDCQKPVPPQNIPFCDIQGNIAVSAVAVNKVGKLRDVCLTATNLSGETRGVQAVLLGAKGQQTRRFLGGATKSLCVVLPDQGCPRVNLRERTDNGFIQDGVYPSCGAKWWPARDGNPFLFCATNHKTFARLLAEFRYGNLIDKQWLKPGQRKCFQHSFAHKWRQRLQFAWKEKGKPITANHILLDAKIWRQ